MEITSIASPEAIHDFGGLLIASELNSFVYGRFRQQGSSIILEPL